MANELIDNGIKGLVAEVGVFRGTFAKLINEKFKDRDFSFLIHLKDFIIVPH